MTTFEESIDGINADMEIKLGYHLQYNHYPPISTAFVPACKEAIEKVNAGLPDVEITMANGVTLTARRIVDELNLDFWIELEEDY